MHYSSSSADAGATMRTARIATLDFLLSARRRDQGESASHAAAGRTVLGVALFRKPQVCGGAGTGVATGGQPKTSATTDADHGHRGLVPEAEPQPSGSGPRDLSILASRRHHQPAQPGLEHRYYLYSNALRFLVSGSHHRLVQPLRIELGSVQHDGGRLLPVHAGDGIARGPVRDLQLRPGLAVYFQPVPSTAQGPRHLDQHGWTRAGIGQCFHREAVAVGEVRIDLPRRVRLRHRTLVSPIPLLRPLQFSTPSPGAELLHPGRHLSEPPLEDNNKVSRCAAVFAFSAHGLAQELHQSNADNSKALRLPQRAYQPPIASEPVRRFGRGHAPGATPMRSLSLAEISGLCDLGFQPAADHPKIAPIFVQRLGSTSYPHEVAALSTLQLEAL